MRNLKRALSLTLASVMLLGMMVVGSSAAAGYSDVEAASMMMRALGYFKYTEDYADGFQLVTVRQGSEIGIFNGIGTDATTPMTRNQVAQMALNALRSNMVKFTGTPGIEVNGVKVGYKAEYTPRTGTEAKYDAITGLTTTILTDNGQYFIQLGEQLYDGKLRLEDTTDDFGRPARYWEYDGSGIGTYVKEELIRKEYVGEVTSKDLYNLLGASALRNNELVVYIDGVSDKTTNAAVFDVTELTRAGANAVGGTGTGVLTQVFVDANEELITVSVINTYLAKAAANYNDKKESVSLTAYGVEKTGDIFVKDGTKNANVTAYSEDYVLAEDAKADDFFLVTLANGAVQSFVKAPTVDDVTLNSFKKDSWVNAEGTKYEYADTAKYDPSVLNQYDASNMKNTTYKLYLDRYDNLIGIEIVEEELNYVFIGGFEGFSSVLGKANTEAFAIFPDGTSSVITVKDAQDVTTAGGSKWSDNGWAGTGAMMNQWYSYTTDKNGDYTLKRIPYALGTGKVAQGWDNTATEINKSHVSLRDTTNAGATRAYGNDETVYLLTKNGVNANGDGVINGVASTTTGVANVDIKVNLAAPAPGNPGVFQGASYLHNDKGYIIAAVVYGEDNGNVKDYMPSSWTMRPPRRTMTRIRTSGSGTARPSSTARRSS